MRLKWLEHKITRWLTKDHPKVENTHMCDYEQLSYEIKPCDVLLIEGQSHVSHVIKGITQSPWTHAALYIGRLSDIQDEDTRNNIRNHFDGDENKQLILEALMGEGTIINALDKYSQDHVRICRPKTLSRQDASRVIAYTTRRLGCDYDVRQLLDLARFLFPYGILPRRWRSSLFQHNVGSPTRAVCSSLIAAAFSSVHFPILPVIEKSDNGKIKLYRRNFRLYTPPDFDYSPYFEIIKYPYLGLEEIAIYRKLPWDQDGIICNSENDCYIPKDYIRINENDKEAESSVLSLKDYQAINAINTRLKHES